MELVTFSTLAQPARAGILEDGLVYDVSELTRARGIAPAIVTMLELLNTEQVPGAWLDEVLEWGRARGLGIPIGTTQRHAPVSRPGKLVCSAGNYQAHFAESGEDRVDKATTVPRLFLKPSSSVIGPGEPILLPAVSNAVDWEAELAVVIGRRGSDIPEARALEHVAGYTVINDISARALAVSANRVGVPGDDFFDWLIGKFPDSFAPLGPSIITRDAVVDPQALDIRLTVNGEVRQDANTREMIYSIAELIAYASRFVTLEPGDVIATGTPHGVGAATGKFLHEGDQVSAWIQGVGQLDNPVRRRDPRTD
jgi:2-keto-4-pentenoate hydratase/2-oxohepta-3-ene-1,7-dioic acid hydratase in catechol pathway